MARWRLSFHGNITLERYASVVQFRSRLVKGSTDWRISMKVEYYAYIFVMGVYCIYAQAVSPTTFLRQGQYYTGFGQEPWYFIDLSGREPIAFLLSRTHELAYIFLAFMLIINWIWDASNDFVKKLKKYCMWASTSSYPEQQVNVVLVKVKNEGRERQDRST